MSRKTTSRPRVSVKTRDLMKRFETAAVSLSWIGSRMADEHAGIERQYRKARAAFVRHLVEIEGKAGGS